jgi:hypothetical protein
MHTRSRDKATGKFVVQVWDWHGSEWYRGTFASHLEADAEGSRQERLMTLAMQAGEGPAPEAMSDDELLTALQS